jgi:hypothetical protein
MNYAIAGTAAVGLMAGAVVAVRLGWRSRAGSLYR